MAEYTNAALQTVAAGQNVQFAETPVRGDWSVDHRAGSGIVNLRAGCGCTLYKVSFGGNIAVATGGTVGPISLAISVAGEPLASATMIVTPSAVGDYFNVYASVLVRVACGCCAVVSVENTSGQPIDVQNANLIVEIQ
jgi:hypothetical protein